MAEAGLETHELLRKSDSDAVDALVRGESRPTAVICYSDLESTLLMHALWQYGVSVPADVSIIGFNDVFSTRYMTPPLTTMGFGTWQSLRRSGLSTDDAADLMARLVVAA